VLKKPVFELESTQLCSTNAPIKRNVTTPSYMRSAVDNNSKSNVNILMGLLHYFPHFKCLFGVFLTGLYGYLFSYLSLFEIFVYCILRLALKMKQMMKINSLYVYVFNAPEIVDRNLIRRSLLPLLPFCYFVAWWFERIPQCLVLQTQWYIFKQYSCALSNVRVMNDAKNSENNSMMLLKLLINVFKERDNYIFIMLDSFNLIILPSIIGYLCNFIGIDTTYITTIDYHRLICTILITLKTRF
jgi:hypothetical protein